MMRYTLDTINKVDDTTYRVLLVSEDGESVSFNMCVELGPVETVTWDKVFSEFVGYKTAPLSPLFEAVLKFHRATSCVVPSE